MEIKLAAIDLDGTLLREDMTVSEFTKEILQKAAEKIKIVVATGRMFDSACAKANLLGLGDLPVICYTGAWAGMSASGTFFWKDGLALPVAEKILGEARERGWEVQAYWDDEICMEKPSPAQEKYMKYRAKPPVYMGEAFYHPASAPTRLILVEADPARKDALRAELEEKYGDDIEMVYPGDDFLDIHKRGISKAEALKKFATMWQISPAEMAAFGNTENDASMLRLAGRSYAVANAEPAAKEAAKKILPRTNDEDAVAWKLAEVLGLG